jgi:hypothetical protein
VVRAGSNPPHTLRCAAYRRAFVSRRQFSVFWRAVGDGIFLDAASSVDGDLLLDVAERVAELGDDGQPVLGERRVERPRPADVVEVALGGGGRLGEHQQREPGLARLRRSLRQGSVHVVGC